MCKWTDTKLFCMLYLYLILKMQENWTVANGKKSAHNKMIDAEGIIHEKHRFII